MVQSPPKVLIVGAGPTGCTLALLLARSGVRCALVERNATPQSHPAACILSTRTMEIFREIGVAEDILQRCQNIFDRANISWVTHLSGHELGRCSALADDLAALRAVSPVHATHFPQNRLEPLLWERVRREPSIAFLPGHDWLGLAGTSPAARSLVRSPAGKRLSLSSDYLVACDGASSRVRQAIGVSAEGRVLQHMIGIHFTADLGRLVDHRRSVLYWLFSPNAFGVLIAHWLPEEWVLLVPFFPPQQSPGDFTGARARALVEAAIGSPGVEADIGLVRPWAVAAQLAARFRHGPVFLAGDAAHVFPPTGGFGLNTGIQDAHNLAWKLAAVIRGRAGPGLLDSYEQERRPVARTYLRQSLRNFERMNELSRVVGLDHRRLRRLAALQNASLFRRLPASWRTLALDGVLRHALARLEVLAADSPRGRRAREAFVRRLPGQAPHYRFLGLDLGFRYGEGALIPEAAADARADDAVMTYRPTTRPGARLPHFPVERDGARLSVHDVLEPDALTLLVHEAAAAPWRAALSRIEERIPMTLRCVSVGSHGGADLADRAEAWPALSETGETGALLVRPDGHVAWRARSLPDAPDERLLVALRRVLFLIPR